MRKHTGRLRCQGSSLFLKSRFGIGYELLVTLRATNHPELRSARLMHHVVQAHVESASFKSVFNHADGCDIAILLPKEQSKSFAALLEALESPKARNKYGIVNAAIDTTSLEEIFLQLGSGWCGQLLVMFHQSAKQVQNEWESKVSQVNFLYKIKSYVFSQRKVY